MATNLIDPQTLKPVPEAAYLTAENAWRYRALEIDGRLAYLQKYELDDLPFQLFLFDGHVDLFENEVSSRR